MKDRPFFCLIRTRWQRSLIKRLRVRWPFLVLAWVMAAMAGEGVVAVAAQATDQPPAKTAYAFNNRTIIRADFDNDNQLDWAILRRESASYTVEIQLSSRPEKISYTVPPSAFISFLVCDIDGDEDDDLVILSGAPRQALDVWLNKNGHGRFERGRGPSNDQTAWTESGADYRHARDPVAPAGIGQKQQFPYAGPRSGYEWTKLKSENSAFDPLRRTVSRTPAYRHQGRSPPFCHSF